MRRIAGNEGELPARQRYALYAACCAVVVCVASAAALAVVALLHRGDSSWDYGCRTSFCVRAFELMKPPPGAPSPCDDFYGHVCFAFTRSRIDFLEALRLRRKTEYHESVLADRQAAATGNASDMLAYAHQVCAQFSHRQNPTLRTMASQMRLSLEVDMKSFLEARSSHNSTMHALTWAAVRMGISTLFNVTEGKAARRLHIYARHALFEPPNTLPHKAWGNGRGRLHIPRRTFTSISLSTFCACLMLRNLISGNDGAWRCGGPDKMISSVP